MLTGGQLGCSAAQASPVRTSGWPYAPGWPVQARAGSPDTGTARADFPGGDARKLYRSIRTLFDLPADTRLFLCHDYPPGGRVVQAQSSPLEQRLHNIHVGGDADEASFVKLRTERDATLAAPRLILPALQVNIRAGELPPPDRNGIRYLRLPLDRIGGAK